MPPKLTNYHTHAHALFSLLGLEAASQATISTLASSYKAQL